MIWKRERGVAHVFTRGFFLEGRQSHPNPSPKRPNSTPKQITHEFPRIITMETNACHDAQPAIGSSPKHPTATVRLLEVLHPSTPARCNLFQPLAGGGDEAAVNSNVSRQPTAPTPDNAIVGIMGSVTSVAVAYKIPVPSAALEQLPSCESTVDVQLPKDDVQLPSSEPKGGITDVSSPVDGVARSTSQVPPAGYPSVTMATNKKVLPEFAITSS